jgi:hypothetical protein
MSTRMEADEEWQKGQPFLRQWELQSNSTRYERLVAAPSDHDLRVMWSIWAGIDLWVGKFTILVFLSIGMYKLILISCCGTRHFSRYPNPYFLQTPPGSTIHMSARVDSTELSHCYTGLKVSAQYVSSISVSSDSVRRRLRARARRFRILS